MRSARFIGAVYLKRPFPRKLHSGDGSNIAISDPKRRDERRYRAKTRVSEVLTRLLSDGECLKVKKRLRRPKVKPTTKDSDNLRGTPKEVERILADSSELQTFKLETNT